MRGGRGPFDPRARFVGRLIIRLQGVQDSVSRKLYHALDAMHWSLCRWLTMLARVGFLPRTQVVVLFCFVTLRLAPEVICKVDEVHHGFRLGRNFPQL